MTSAPRHGSGSSGSGTGSGTGTSTGSGGTGTGSGGGSTGSGSSGGSGSSSGNAVPSPSGFYGSGTNADALNNLTIGPHVVSYRFLSTHTGTVSNVHFYLIVNGPHAGYNSGTGGTLKIQLETDDGSDAHQPLGTVLATHTIPHPSDPFPVISFSPAPKLEAGELYHLVFSNTDSDPTENFVSVDDLYMNHPLNPMQPDSSNADLVTLTRDSANSWSVFDFNTPIFEFDFADGASFGQGYMEVWPESPEPISDAQAVREKFTVSGGDRAVTQISIRVARISGTADLTVQLEDADGILVEKGTIPSSEIPASSSAYYVWATYKFSAMRTLLDGQSYHLVLETSAGTTYQAYPLRKGSAQNFQSTPSFQTVMRSSRRAAHGPGGHTGE